MFFIAVAVGLSAGCGALKEPTTSFDRDKTARSELSDQSQGPVSWHAIESGQTLWRLARGYGLPIEALKAFNPQIRSDAIPVGTLIRLPGLFDQAVLRVGDDFIGRWPLAGVREETIRLSSETARTPQSFPSPPGRRVFASANGVVVLYGRLPIFGTTVVIRHDQGFYGIYGGLKAVDCRPGDVVTAGQRIAVTSGRPFHFALIPLADTHLARRTPRAVIAVGGSDGVR